MDAKLTAGAGRQALPPGGVAQVARCLRTLRSVRRFWPRDVDPELIEFVLDLAVRAGSGSNRQPWRFVVVRDPAVRRRLGDWYRQGWNRLEAARRTADHHPGATAAQHRITASARQLALNFAAAPVVIVACYLPSRPGRPDLFAGASIYPAVQNLLLAARAVGLGATLTTMQALDGPAGRSARPSGLSLCDELRHILQIPAEAVPAAVIPLGWPAQLFGETARRPAADVTYADRWGSPWSPAHGR